MRIKQRKLITWVVLLFTLTSNFLPVLKPVLAYAENDPETSQMAEQEK
ncbi:hypothetical protein GQR36_04160 [Enterococcus termitis]